MSHPEPPGASPSLSVPLGTPEQGSFRFLLGVTPCEGSWGPNESKCHLGLPQPREPAGLCNPTLPPSLARKSNKAGQASGVRQSWSERHGMPATLGQQCAEPMNCRELSPEVCCQEMGWARWLLRKAPGGGQEISRPGDWRDPIYPCDGSSQGRAWADLTLCRAQDGSALGLGCGALRRDVRKPGLSSERTPGGGCAGVPPGPCWSLGENPASRKERRSGHMAPSLSFCS